MINYLLFIYMYICYYKMIISLFLVNNMCEYILVITYIFWEYIYYHLI